MGFFSNSELAQVKNSGYIHSCSERCLISFSQKTQIVGEEFFIEKSSPMTNLKYIYNI